MRHDDCSIGTIVNIDDRQDRQVVEQVLDYKSAIALVHSRFSTDTTSNWEQSLAQK